MYILEINVSNNVATHRSVQFIVSTYNVYSDRIASNSSVVSVNFYQISVIRGIQFTAELRYNMENKCPKIKNVCL